VNIFSLLLLVPILLIYLGIGCLYLLAFRRRVNWIGLSTFVCFGCGGGFAAAVIYGFLVADPNGQLTSKAAVFGLFATTALAALSGSVIGVWIIERLRMKYNNRLKSDFGAAKGPSAP